MIDKNNSVVDDLDDEEEFDDAVENLMFSMRIQAEFYSYPTLMEMAKKFHESADKEAYLDSIKLDINEELAKSIGFGPSKELLEMIFQALEKLDLDFLVAVSKLIKTEQQSVLFEGMVYMGMSMEEEELEEE